MRIAGSPGQQGRSGEDELLPAVRAAATAEYEILSEMGRGERGTVVYLARERSTQKLVALKLRPDGSDYELSVLRELDATVPSTDNTCPFCKATLHGWGRFCSHCGKDLFGAQPDDGSREELLAVVRELADGEYDVLGEMQRSEGGGVVYFARELDSGRLVALRLIRQEDSEGAHAYSLGVTQVIKPLLASLGASNPASTSGTRMPAATPLRSTAATPRLPQPAARSVTPPSVMVPDDYSLEKETAPPKKRVPIIPIALGVAVLLIAGTLVRFSGSPRSTTDLSQDPSENVVVAAPAPALAPGPPASAAVATPRIDSATVSIQSLPSGARLTVNGKPVNGRLLSLLPGSYQLAVTAPGFESTSERIDVSGGQMLTWTPAMQSAKSTAKPPSKKARVETKTEITKRPAAAPTCFDAYSEKKYTMALLECTREANAGNQPAQRNLAVMYDQGLGVTENPTQAAVWFRKAAETGNRDAAFQLASMYENGRGVSKDQKSAIDWYRKAALLGDGDAQVKLGREYADGKGVTRDDGEASAWFQRAADQGSLYALNRLGAMYADGKGVRKDESKSVKLFQAASAKGDAQGQFNLAAMYAKGRGVQKSDSAANDLYIKSAKQGYADAIKEARRRNLRF
ncbi:MAG: PEGA domain-containing protein [Gemmatimonadota bacterium]